MALIQFDPVVALDAETADLIKSGAGTIHAVDDVQALTPLAVTDLAGIPLAGGQVLINRGLVTAFKVANHQRVLWASGEHRVVIWSPTGLQKAADDAAAAAAASAASVNADVQRATSAADRAVQAAQTATAPTDTTVASLVTTPTSATAVALSELIRDGGAGTGIPVQADPPVDPVDGDVWWSSVTGALARWDASVLGWDDELEADVPVGGWLPVAEASGAEAGMALALGTGATAGHSGVAVGSGSTAADRGVAVGLYASAAEASVPEGGSTAVGFATLAGDMSFAAGFESSAPGPLAVALGVELAAVHAGSIIIGASDIAPGSTNPAKNMTVREHQCRVLADDLEVLPSNAGAGPASTLTLRSPSGAAFTIGVSDGGELVVS